jgi:hypothetical protein
MFAIKINYGANANRHEYHLPAWRQPKGKENACQSRAYPSAQTVHAVTRTHHPAFVFVFQVANSGIDRNTI